MEALILIGILYLFMKLLFPKTNDLKLTNSNIGVISVAVIAGILILILSIPSSLYSTILFASITLILISVGLYFYYRYKKGKNIKILKNSLMTCIYENFPSFLILDEKIKYATYDDKTHNFRINMEGWNLVKEGIIEETVRNLLQNNKECLKIQIALSRKVGDGNYFNVSYEVDKIESIVDKDLNVLLNTRNNILRSYKNLIDLEMFEHKDTLIRKRKQFIIFDDYNISDNTKWDEEKKYFLNKVVHINYNIEGFEDVDLLLDYIDIKLDEFESSDNDDVDDLKFDESMDGWAYEHYCKNLLEKYNWKAKVTKGSGDQGVDIIAYKDKYKVAIQCKKYTSPVNNKAVQEVFAAKEYIGANSAVVITNNTYTKSAKELAENINVKLLHHDEIKSLDNIL